MNTSTSVTGPGSADPGPPRLAAGPLIGRRFMRRLSIGAKLWTTTMILSVPLVGLAAFYVESLTSTLFFTAAEQHGLALARPLVEINAGLGRHAVLEAALLQQGKSAGSELDRSAQDIDSQLGELQKLDESLGNAATHAQLQSLQHAWEALKIAHPGSLKESAVVHQAAIDAALAMKSEVVTDWKIVLDPELLTYNVLDVGLMKLPDVQQDLSQVQSDLYAVTSHGDYQPAAGAALLKSLSLLEDRLGGAHDELAQAAAAGSVPAAVAQQLGAVGSDWYGPTVTWMTQLNQEMQTGKPHEDVLLGLIKSSDPIATTVDRARLDTQKAADLALQLRHGRQSFSAMVALGGAVIGVLSAILVMLALIRRVSGAVKRLLQISEHIAIGDFESRIDATGTDEFSRLFIGMDGMQKQLKSKIESERLQAAENIRIKSALDMAGTNLMIADTANDIIYVNKAAQSLFRNAQQDLRRDVPALDAERIVGSNIDIFHKSPSHQRNLLANLKATHIANIKIGGRSMRIIANPVMGADGSRVATIVEWFDRTEEVRAEEEVAGIVAQALDGHLQARVVLTDKSGFIQALGKGLNELLDNMSEMVRQIKSAAAEVTRGADEISQGNANLSQRTEEQSSSP